MKLSIFCFILAQISETSNLNFDKINRNFHSIHSTEDALTTSVRNLATTMKGEMSDEQKLERKVITNQMSQFLSDQKAIYLASLQQIHDSIRTPPLLSFIQDLATNRDFCSAFTCYKQTNFLYEDETLHVTTQKHTVTLQEQVLLTCSLLHENMVSKITILNALRMDWFSNQLTAVSHPCLSVPLTQFSTTFLTEQLHLT